MSDQTTTDTGRRRFLTLNATCLAIAPFLNLLVTHVAKAKGPSTDPDLSSEIPRLPENDRQAIALGYAEDAESIAASKFQRDRGQFCQNCQLYSGSPGEFWGPCAIFSYRVEPKLKRNYVVSSKGWCRSWGPRRG